MAFAYLKEIIEAAEKENKPFWQIVIEDDMRERNVSYEQSFETMRGMYQAMKEADAAYDPKLRSASGMVGGDGEKLEEFHKEKESSDRRFPDRSYGEGSKNGRVQCLYEKNCCCTYSWLLWCYSGCSSHI